MLIALHRFEGERPRVGARLLDSSQAQAARNCKLWDGRLQPWFPPRFEQNTFKPGPAKSIYRFGDGGYWLHWPTDVDVVRGPIAGSQRLYWTGDGPPKFGTLETIAGVTTLTGPAPLGQNFLIVNNALGFAPGQSITITLDSGPPHTTLITTIQLSLNRLNLQFAMPGAAAAGNAVVNNDKSYPHGSYLLGVPAPTAPPVAAVTAAANQGTVSNVLGVLGEQTGSNTTTAQTFSIDLANIDSDGGTIEFEVEALFNGSIASVQSKTIIVQVRRAPAGANEVIYETRDTMEVQGPASPEPLELPPSLIGVVNWDPRWRELIAAGIASDQAAASAARKKNLRFEFTPADGPQTYRLTITHDFVAAASAPNWNYSLRITARLGTQRGITLVPADHGLREGDTIQFGGIEGSGSISDLNKGPVTVLSVEGAVVYVDTEASGVYTGSGGTWKQVWAEADLESRSYVYTYVVTVDGQDMEGPPSPPSAQALVGDNQSVTVSGFIDPTTLGDGRPYRAIWVYRTSVGDEADAEFLFDRELLLPSASFIDTVRGDDLGEVIPSTFWEPPPADLVGLIELPNGLMAGFRLNTNEVCICEPYQPHAWPPQYRRAMLDTVICIAAFGSSIAVTTKGRPTVITGTDPAAMSEEHIEVVHPNVAKRGTVDMGYGILYPTEIGLCYIAQGEASIISEHTFTEDQWKALNPQSFVAAKFGGRYFCFYSTAQGQAAFILDPRQPQTLTFLDLATTEIWSDPRTDKLYFVAINSAGVEQIVEWNAEPNAIPQAYRWRSKEFTIAVPNVVRRVKVDAELYPVQVNLFADGQVYGSIDVFSSAPVTVNAKRGMARKWEVELIGSTPVEAVYVASSMEALTNYFGG